MVKNQIMRELRSGTANFDESASQESKVAAQKPPVASSSSPTPGIDVNHKKKSMKDDNGS